MNSQVIKQNQISSLLFHISLSSTGDTGGHQSGRVKDIQCRLKDNGSSGVWGWLLYERDVILQITNPRRKALNQSLWNFLLLTFLSAYICLSEWETPIDGPYSIICYCLCEYLGMLFFLIHLIVKQNFLIYFVLFCKSMPYIHHTG